MFLIASLQHETEDQILYKGLLKTLENIIKTFDRFICKIINTIVNVAPFVKKHDKRELMIETFLEKQKKTKTWRLPDGKGGFNIVEVE